MDGLIFLSYIFLSYIFLSYIFLSYIFLSGCFRQQPDLSQRHSQFFFLNSIAHARRTLPVGERLGKCVRASVNSAQHRLLPHLHSSTLKAEKDKDGD